MQLSFTSKPRISSIYFQKVYGGDYLKKKYLFFLLLPAVFLALFLTLVLQPKSADELFTSYVVAYSQDCFENDALSLHYSISNPSIYGIEEASSGLPIYDQDSYLNQSAQLTKQILELEAIEYSQLSPMYQEDYELLYDALSSAYLECNYPYYANPLTPDSGMQTSLPILLSEFYLEDIADIETYFMILQAVPDYLNGLYDYLCDRTEYGIPCSSASLAETASQCNEILNAEELNNGTHFLIVTFQERLMELLEGSIITEAEYADYISRNQELLTTLCLPAYESLAIQLTTLTPTCETETGLSSYPDGQAYYTYLLAQATGSARSIPELKELLTTSFQTTYIDYLETAQTIEELLLISSEDVTLSLPFSTCNEMIEDLIVKMEDDFPILDHDADISYEVKEVSPSLEPYVAPAFYLTPPMDRITSNTIYVNYEYPIDPLTLYTTLAHEGYPGHLYQSVYHYSSVVSLTDALLTPLMSYLGYVEGWAYYVENLSYEYAKESLVDSPTYNLSALYIDSIRLNRNLQLCFYSLLDLAIHYDGISYEETHALLSQFGITDATQTQEMYDYIVQNPATYPTYYIGYEEVLATKELAQELWQDSYSELRFHTFYLEAGPMDFTTLQEKIALY